MRAAGAGDGVGIGGKATGRDLPQHGVAAVTARVRLRGGDADGLHHVIGKVNGFDAGSSAEMLLGGK